MATETVILVILAELNARAPFAQGVGNFVEAIADGADNAHAGNHNPSHQLSS